MNDIGTMKVSEIKSVEWNLWWTKEGKGVEIDGLRVTSDNIPFYAGDFVLEFIRIWLSRWSERQKRRVLFMEQADTPRKRSN